MSNTTVQIIFKEKHKASIDELPCKVGDVVYVIKNNKICAKDVVYYSKIQSRVAEQNEEYWHCVDKDRNSINVFTFYPENIGKTVFLTKEEAESSIYKEYSKPIRITNRDYCNSINHNCNKCKFFEQFGSESVKINVCTMKYNHIEDEEFIE